jgi:hypothetical protein
MINVSFCQIKYRVHNGGYIVTGLVCWLRANNTVFDDFVMYRIPRINRKIIGSAKIVC